MRVRAVHQLLGALSVGDAIGNEAMVFRGFMRAQGYESEIFAGDIAPEMTGLGLSIAEFARRPPAPDSLLIFHFSLGTPVAEVVLARPEPLILRYHNVTPHRYFLGFSGHVVGLSYHGARRLASFARRASLGLAVSEFNRLDLQRAWFKETATIPLSMNMAALDTPPDRLVPLRYKDGRRNILVVGRVAPNKKIEDLIRVFCAYQRYVEPLSRLLIVGEGRGFANYTRRLDEMVSHLRLDEVVFTGAVTQSELNAYYQVADAFVCLSEHEGYGAPLVEAMHFDLPVIAYDAGAVRETLQGGGILLKGKDPQVVAELLGVLMNDATMRAAVLKTETEALARIRSVDIGVRLEAAVQSVGGAS